MVLAKNADPDEMPPYAAFIWVFTLFQSTHLHVPVPVLAGTGTRITSDRCHSETLILSTSVDRKSLETGLSIAICRLTGDKWQSKTLFIAIYDPRLSIVKSVFYCRLSDVGIQHWMEFGSLYLFFFLILVFTVRVNKVSIGAKSTLLFSLCYNHEIPSSPAEAYFLPWQLQAQLKLWGPV